MSSDPVENCAFLKRSICDSDTVTVWYQQTIYELIITHIRK